MDDLAAGLEQLRVARYKCCEDACAAASGACAESEEDDEEVALCMQAAEVALSWRARDRFTDSKDLIQRLFVCISGVSGRHRG